MGRENGVRQLELAAYKNSARKRATKGARQRWSLGMGSRLPSLHETLGKQKYHQINIFVFVLLPFVLYTAVWD